MGVLVYLPSLDWVNSVETHPAALACALACPKEGDGVAPNGGRC
jgi:hypothetical protein